MRLLIGLIFITVIGNTETSRERFEGDIFKYKNKFYITEKFQTTSPQYLIEWLDLSQQKNVCLANESELCPKQSIVFYRLQDKKKGTIFTKAKIVAPYKDHEMLLKSVTPKKDK